tara:strand:+ start:1097 stop:1240 length:144 start_codon:yes stop_codon:yes gene_type:complete
MEWYYNEMTDLELLQDATNKELLDYYRKDCLQVLRNRLQAREDKIKL